jgi:hypothetical protein
VLVVLPPLVVATAVILFDPWFIGTGALKLVPLTTTLMPFSMTRAAGSPAGPRSRR